MKMMGFWFVFFCLISLSIAVSIPDAATLGVTQDKITIGNLNTLSGPAAVAGIAARDGGILALEEINALGGVHGRKLDFVFADDGCSSEVGAESVKKFIDAQVFGIVGGYCSAPAVAVTSLAQKLKMPVVFSGGSTSMITYPPKKYVFHAAGTGNTRDTAIGEIDYFVRERGAKTIGIIYQADPFGETILKEQRTRLRIYGLAHSLELPFNKGDTDFTSQLVKAKGANLEVLFIAAMAQDTAIIVRQAKQLGLTCFIYGSLGTATGNFLGVAGEAAVGIRFSYPFEDDIDSSLPNYQEMKQRLIARFGKAPGQPNVKNLNGYVGMKVFAEGLKRAGRDLTREKFITALESLKDYSAGIGFPFTFSSTRRAGCHSGAVFEVVSTPEGPKYKKVDMVLEAPSSSVDIYNKVEE